MMAMFPLVWVVVMAAGAAAGYYLVFWINIALTMAAIVIGSLCYTKYKDAELGVIIGIMQAVVAFSFVIAQWAAMAFIYLPTLDFSFVLR